MGESLESIQTPVYQKAYTSVVIGDLWVNVLDSGGLVRKVIGHGYLFALKALNLQVNDHLCTEWYSRLEETRALPLYCNKSVNYRATCS